MSTEAKRRGNKKYLATLANINLRIRPIIRDEMKAAADHAGQSMTQYILQACRERMERDGFQMQEPEEAGEEEPELAE